MIPGANAEFEQQKAKREAVLGDLPPAVRQALELDDSQEADLAPNSAAHVRRILEYIAGPSGVDGE